MSGYPGAQFLHLNKGGQWRDCLRYGLTVSEGALRLKTLPRHSGDVPAGLATLPAPQSLAGIAQTDDGDLFWTLPGSSQIMTRDPCDGTIRTASCLGDGSRQGLEFRDPSGISFHPLRRAFVIADTGNHRLQLLDPRTFQLLTIWGQPPGDDDPQPSTLPGRFDSPRAVAIDSSGRVYVAEFSGDRNHRRIQQFDLGGNVVPRFWENMWQEGHVNEPLVLVGRGVADRFELLVLDARDKTVRAYDADGKHVRLLVRLDATTRPMGLAADAGGIFVGDNARRRILVYSADGKPISEAGYHGPVAALAIGAAGQILVNTGAESREPVQLERTRGHVKFGFVLSRGITNPSNNPEQWHRIRATLDPLPAGAHAQLYVYTQAPDAGKLARQPDEAPWEPDRCQLSSIYLNDKPPEVVGKWIAVPLDAPECLIPGAPGTKVYMGVELRGEGEASATLRQLRIDFDLPTYLRYLPQVYSNDDEPRRFLTRFLSLFQTFFHEAEDRIDRLPALFDPRCVPVSKVAELAHLMGLEFSGTRDVPQKRRAIAESFAMYATRGTAERLRHAAVALLGLPVRIEEPLQQSSWWALPGEDPGAPPGAEHSILGFTTMLASDEPQGAVVGTTAVIDQSKLIDQRHYASASFGDVAHRFSVWLYRGWGDDECTLALLRGLLDLEKPAHTRYDVCVVQPAMRLGYQARVGIDTVVAGGEPPGLVDGIRLGGWEGGRVGQSRVGQTTRLEL